MIRPAQHGDVPAIMALHERCWRISYAGIADADGKFRRPVQERERMWAQLLPSTWVSETVDGFVAGFVTVGRSRDEDAADGTGEIWAVYVDPEHQGGGHGRALVARAEQLLRDAGFTRVTLWTFRHNPASRAFYERIGYVHDGTDTTDEDGAIVRYVREL